MSIAPQPLPPNTGSAPGPEPAIRRQAAEIIDSVLAGSGPEQAEIRDQLRECVAAHPGRPEAALLEHLMAIRAVSRFRDRMQDTIPAAATLPDQPLNGALVPC